MFLPDPRERPWLTVAEVARITGEGEKAIRSAIDAGQLPHLQVGRYVRIPTAALWRLCQIDPEMQTDVPCQEERPSLTTVRHRSEVGTPDDATPRAG